MSELKGEPLLSFQFGIVLGQLLKMSDQATQHVEEEEVSKPRGGAPRYQQVAKILINAIETGEYTIGMLLPTEFELCDQFECSRYTIREALRLLFEAGFVSRRRGAGTIVIAAKRPPIFNHALDSIDDIIQYARNTRFEVVDVGHSVMGEDLSKHLSLPQGGTWIEAFGIRYNAYDPRPVCLMWVYVDPKLEGIQEKFDRPPRALAEIIEDDFGIRIARIEQKVNGLSIGPEDARNLKVEASSPGVRIVRRYLDEAGNVVQVSDNLFPADRVSLSMTFDREPN